MKCKRNAIACLFPLRFIRNFILNEKVSKKRSQKKTEKLNSKTSKFYSVDGWKEYVNKLVHSVPAACNFVFDVVTKLYNNGELNEKEMQIWFKQLFKIAMKLSRVCGREHDTCTHRVNKIRKSGGGLI